MTWQRDRSSPWTGAAAALLLAALGIGGTAAAQAQTETVLHSFANDGIDGFYPVAALVLDAQGNIYGTTQIGGANHNGTVVELTSGGYRSRALQLR